MLTVNSKRKLTADHDPFFHVFPEPFSSSAI